ncbi:Lsa family ABC-F type ribosomal protection protein [Deltaproteobacteria bacterium Smac51]|nr:Lsa family ABC-F type ribosomal protection protein [Deltaproteobacteria bacterium Smac51]
MAQINISNLTFAHYGAAENLFDKVSLSLDTDWKLGFIGRNGRGKTTFLRLLMNDFEYSGTISTPVDFDYFPSAAHHPDGITAEVLRKIVDYEDWRLGRELSLLAVAEDVLERPFQTLSGGEKTKVLLAALFLKDNNFLLIDEPTNHLDLEGRMIVGQYLRKKKGFILISHDRAFLDQCIDHVLSINRDGLEVQKGNFSTWQLNRDYRENFEQAQSDKLIKDIKMLGESARRAAGWSERAEKGKFGSGPCDRGFIGHKAAKMMKRSKAVERRREAAVEEKKQLLRSLETNDPLAIPQLRHHTKLLVNMKELSVRYGERVVVKNVDLTIEQGERLAITGPNGCGKSSLLKLAAGEAIACGGLFQLASNLTVSYVPQDTSFLSGGLRAFIRSANLDESLFKAVLHKLGFEKRQFEGDLSTFSGGEKKKVLIAASLCTPAHLYIWDEPLNFIDVISRMQIEKLILDYKPTMLIVEHDQEFLKNIAAKEFMIKL